MTSGGAFDYSIAAVTELTGTERNDENTTRAVDVTAR